MAVALQHDLQQLLVLLFVPWSFLDLRVQVAAPVLPTLLGSPINLLFGVFFIESFGDGLPVFGANLAEWYWGYLMIRKRRFS